MLKEHAIEASQKVNNVLSGRAPIFVNVQNNSGKQDFIPVGETCIEDTELDVAVGSHNQPVKMSRSLQTVCDVWREYAVGLGDRQELNIWKQNLEIHGDNRLPNASSFRKGKSFINPLEK